MYEFHENGNLSLAEPYYDNQIHGTAKQYDRDGNLIGTYELEHGTGYDIWRQAPHDEDDEPQIITISEIWSWRGGKLHGFEMWLSTEKQTESSVDDNRFAVWAEKHWHNGCPHGIERNWNLEEPDRLDAGNPKFWIDGEEVSRGEYEARAKTDDTLPPRG